MPALSVLHCLLTNGKTEHSHGNMLNLNLKKTMKKYLIFLASAAMLLATSCAKEEVNTTGETELITVQLNPETKTALGAEGTTTWDADDKVSVTVGGEVVGTLSLVEGSTFSGEITAGLSGDATLNYPADVTAIPEPQVAVSGSFADDAALLEGTTTVEDLRAGNSVELKNKTALLKFTVAQAGNVTFEVGTAKYTVTGCKTGATYYACVAPASNVAFTARIGGYLSRKASSNVTFTANKIANLETLPAPEKLGWGIVGQHQGWDITNPTPMYKVDDDVYAVLNIKLEDNGFKFAKNGLKDWNTASTTTFGAWTKSDGKDYFDFMTEMAEGAWYGNPLYSDNASNDQQNIGVSDFSKNYDVYIRLYGSGDWGIGVKYTVVSTGTKVTYPN